METISNFEIRLNTSKARVIFVGVFWLTFALFSYRVSRLAWAAEQLESTDQHSIGKALSVDEKNPVLHNWAGVIYLNGDQFQPERALAEFRRATDLNPWVSEYWANLGRTCFFVNDQICAEDAYIRAVAVAPQRPSVLNELAMYYVSNGNPEKALPYFRRQLELEPASANPILSVCLRSLSPELVWTKIIADQKNMSVEFEFFRILSEEKKDQAAQPLWDQFMSSHPRISFNDAKSYLSLLESGNDYSKLIRVWRDLETLHISGMPLHGERNLVVNSLFEQAPTNVGLDWHIRPEQFVDTQAVAADHGTALQFDFTVPNNEEHESAYQLVAVEPSHQYELHASVRSEEITSDSGPRLRVVDPICTDCVNASSDGTTGTTEWHDVSTTFSTGPATQIVRLSVWRPRSRSFPTEIHGQFSISNISIRTVNKP